MALKTENLAIGLTDIAGFAEGTANQSRVANEKLLAIHNRIPLPIVKRFKGRSSRPSVRSSAGIRGRKSLQ